MTPNPTDLPFNSEGPPPTTFSDVGALLSRPDLWPNWLAKHPDRAPELADAFSRVVRLEAHTGWQISEVLEQLGCTIKTEQELLSGDRLQRCSRYMKWVESLVKKLDLDLDKRLVISSAARFYVASGEDLSVCAEAMEFGDFPALEYLSLGEVSQAFNLALCSLDTSEGERARRTTESNPFMDESAPHISPKRLEMLEDPRAVALLGSHTKALMEEHIDSCGACEAAQEQLGISSGRVRINLPSAA